MHTNNMRLLIIWSWKTLALGLFHVLWAIACGILIYIFWPVDEVVQAVHRNEFTPKFWHEYSEEQIHIIEEICAELMKHYPIKFILGHEEISPGRKIDPGPAFPLDKLRSRLLDSRRDADGPEIITGQELTVMVNELNIRALPDLNAEKVARPLAKGQKVTVLEKKEGWARVTTGITGWVAERYLK